MTITRSVAPIALLLAAGASAQADWALIAQNRFVYAHSSWKWTSGQPTLVQEQNIAAPGMDPFADTALTQFGNNPPYYSRGYGNQTSSPGTSLITAEGRAESEASRGSIGSESDANGESYFEVTFALQEPTTVHLQGHVSALALQPGATGQGLALVELQQNGGAIFASILAQYSQGPGEADVDQTFALLPGSYTLRARAKNNVIGTIQGTSRTITATFDLSLSDAGCYPDCNGDGVLNLSDFGCFTTKFALQDPYADCNGDGVHNLSDFGCFTTKFALGCP